MHQLADRFLRAAVLAALSTLLCGSVFAQKTAEKAGSQAASVTTTQLPKVTQIDIERLKKLLKPGGKPLLINFWATWCTPCTEEFPDLVRLNTEYRDRVDFITVSLDDLADINTYVPKFLGEMRSEIPAYLLHTSDENAAIALVSKDWTGNLPLTVLVEAGGTTAYERNGKFLLPILKENIDRVLGAEPAGNGVIESVDFVKIKNGKRDEARYYYENNWRAYRAEAVKRGLIHSFEYVELAADSNSPFDLLLITRYQNATQFQDREKIFGPLIKELAPNGPFLKGVIKPDDFRQVVYSFNGKSPFLSAK